MAFKATRIAAAKKMLKNPEGGQWEANQNYKASQDEMKAKMKKQPGTFTPTKPTIEQPKLKKETRYRFYA